MFSVEAFVARRESKGFPAEADAQPRRQVRYVYIQLLAVSDEIRSAL